MAPIDYGRRENSDARGSPPPREASPTRTELDFDISYDDELPVNEQDTGNTSAGVSDVALWTVLTLWPDFTSRSQQHSEDSGPATPGQVSGDKRKRSPRSTGSSDGPATKQLRPGTEREDPSSPLAQNRYRGSRPNTTSHLRQPIRRWNTEPSLRDGPNLEETAPVNGTRIPAFRPSNSILEEETTEVSGEANPLSVVCDVPC